MKQKRSSWLLIIFSTILILIVVYSLKARILICTESNEKQPDIASNNFSSLGINFPAGTTFQISGNTLRFDLPDPFYILGVDRNGVYYRSSSGGEGSVTCECTSGSGCDPIKSGDDYGCLMKSNCSQCKQTRARIIGIDNELTDITVIHPDYAPAVDNFNKLNNKYLLNASFIDAPEFKNPLNDLLGMLPAKPWNRTKVIFINIHGYILPVEIPDSPDVDNTSIAFRSVGNGDDAGVTCSCNVSGSCPKQSKLGVVWCNSDNCTKCTMSGRVINPQGEEKLFSAANGYITLQ